MKTRNLLFVFILLFFVVGLAPAPAFAQDAEATDTLIVTVEATVDTMPVTIVATGIAPTQSSSGDVTIIVNNPAPASTPEDTTITPLDGNEGSPPESGATVPAPVVIAGMVFLGVLFVVLLYNQNQVVKVVSVLIPAEMVPMLLDSALPKLTDLVMNTVAAGIPTEIDDALFIEAARSRGLTVVRDPISNTYHTSRTSPDASGRGPGIVAPPRTPNQDS